MPHKIWRRQRFGCRNWNKRPCQILARRSEYGIPDLFMRSAIFAFFVAVLLVQTAATSELDLLKADEAKLAASAPDSPEHANALKRLGAYYRAM